MPYYKEMSKEGKRLMKSDDMTIQMNIEKLLSPKDKIIFYDYIKKEYEIMMMRMGNSVS